MFEMEVAKDLRRQAEELNRQAEEIEKEISQNSAKELIGKYFYDNETYYKILKLSIFSNKLLCFSLFRDLDNNTFVTDYEDLSISSVNQLKEVTKEDVKNVFDELVKFAKEKIFD